VSNKNTKKYLDRIMLGAKPISSTAETLKLNTPGILIQPHEYEILQKNKMPNISEIIKNETKPKQIKFDHK
jgi:hypothetical protein